MIRLLALLALLLPASSSADAPFADGRFRNEAKPGERGGFLTVELPFFAGMVWRTLTESPTGAAPRVTFDPDALRENPSITWIGHSTLLVRVGGVTFLTDPIVSERASPFSFAGPKRLVPPGVPFESLPPIDFATISHDHYDHADLGTIRLLAEKGVPFVVPIGLGDLVREAGGKATELDWGESTEIGAATVHCVPAQHFSGRSLTDRNRTLWAGFVVEAGGRRVYHAGDTGYFDGFAEIGGRFAPIDLAALPIGAYEPREMMGFVHLNPEEAVQAGIDLDADRVVGMHWGTFVLTEEPLDEPPRRFLAEARRRGVGEDRAWILAIGETRSWEPIPADDVSR